MSSDDKDRDELEVVMSSDEEDVLELVDSDRLLVLLARVELDDEDVLIDRLDELSDVLLDDDWNAVSELVVDDRLVLELVLTAVLELEVLIDRLLDVLIEWLLAELRESDVTVLLLSDCDELVSDGEELEVVMSTDEDEEVFVLDELTDRVELVDSDRLELVDTECDDDDVSDDEGEVDSLEVDVSDVLYDECEVDDDESVLLVSLIPTLDDVELVVSLVALVADVSDELDELTDDWNSVDELLDDVALDELVSLPPTANEVVWAPQHWNSTQSAAVRPVRNTLFGLSIGSHRPS